MPDNIIEEQNTKNWETYLEEYGEDTDNIIYKHNESLNIPKHKLAYDDNTPIPGENVDLDNTIAEINENTALDNLITKSAIYKAQSEKNVLYNKQEESRIRKQIIDMILYNEGEAFYQKYHYTMDGKTKRRIRRTIEKNYDNGKYNYLKTTSNLNEP